MLKHKITKDTKIPRHIAIIMDGNGRWAKKRLMPRSFGHKHGMERMIGLMEHAFELGVEYITVYALSTENLKRPPEELEGLFNLLRNHFKAFIVFQILLLVYKYDKLKMYFIRYIVEV